MYRISLHQMAGVPAIKLGLPSKQSHFYFESKPRTSSSAQSSSSTDEQESSTEDEDDAVRGRPNSQTFTKPSSTLANKPSLTFHQRRGSVSSNSGGSSRKETTAPPRPSFTRSRSPAIPQQATNTGISPPFRMGSPSQFTRQRHGSARQNIFSSVFQLSLRLPFSQTVRQVSMESSKACEVILLLGSLGYVATILSTFETERWASIGIRISHKANSLADLSLLEISIIILMSLFYITWSHYSTTKLISHPMPSPKPSGRSASPRLPDQRRHTPVSKRDFGFVWMTVPKNYR